MTIIIRNAERKDAAPLEVEVWALRFDGVTRRFVMSVFCDGEPREVESEQMSPWWTTQNGGGMDVMFSSATEARALESWLNSEDEAATGWRQSCDA